MSWICPKCETENPDRLKVCEVCDSPRESIPEKKFDEKLRKKYSNEAYNSLIRYHHDVLESADLGDCYAQFKIGEWFLNHNNVYTEERNKSASFWLMKAAHQGMVDAQLKLAQWFEEGWGINRSKTEALKWYEKAKNAGNEKARQKYIDLKYDDETYKYVLRYKHLLLEKADSGNPVSQYKIGDWFLNNNTEQYDKIAVGWLRKSATKGNVNAQQKLAKCYEDGRGLPQNREEAMKWYLKAADNGDSNALQNYLKLKYYSKTYQEVVKYRLSLLSFADSGNQNSQFLLGEWFYHHDNQPSYKSEAFVWYTRAAKNGHGEAMYKLGEYYENRLSSNSEAIKWYEKAAKNGNKSSCLKLAESYLYGKLTKKNINEAIKWYRLSGDVINGTDLCNIGYAYDVGDSVPMDKSKAVKYYREAANKGDMVAQYNLGVCYENGDGVTTNLDTARFWYEKAAVQGNVQAHQCISRINSTIHNQKKNKTIERFILSLLIGPIFGAMGFYFLVDVLPKLGICMPFFESNYFPANLIICLVAGFIIMLINENNNV